jgi:hypothetical protein
MGFGIVGLIAELVAALVARCCVMMILPSNF